MRSKIDPIGSESWRQTMFDLMSNRTLRIEIRGNIYDTVDAEIWFCETARKDREIAQVIDADDFEDAMVELMDKAWEVFVKERTLKQESL